MILYFIYNKCEKEKLFDIITVLYYYCKNLKSNFNENQIIQKLDLCNLTQLAIKLLYFLTFKQKDKNLSYCLCFCFVFFALNSLFFLLYFCYYYFLSSLSALWNIIWFLKTELKLIFLFLWKNIKDKNLYFSWIRVLLILIMYHSSLSIDIWYWQKKQQLIIWFYPFFTNDKYNSM